MSPDINQDPEQIARDRIDQRLRMAGWHVQDKDGMDFSVGLGVAVREYQTDVGPADYVLFVDRRAAGVVEAKQDNLGVRLTSVEEQSEGYAKAKLKWVQNKTPLPFLYEATGEITRFTSGHDPAPRSREVFTFHRPENLKDWLATPVSLRSGIAPHCLTSKPMVCATAKLRQSPTLRPRSRRTNLARSSRWPPGRARPSPRSRKSTAS